MSQDVQDVPATVISSSTTATVPGLVADEDAEVARLLALEEQQEAAKKLVEEQSKRIQDKLAAARAQKTTPTGEGNQSSPILVEKAGSNLTASTITGSLELSSETIDVEASSQIVGQVTPSFGESSLPSFSLPPNSTPLEQRIASTKSATEGVGVGGSATASDASSSSPFSQVSVIALIVVQHEFNVSNCFVRIL